ncbi:hypothetical protein ACQ859_23080 [Roseateles chitinivorans]|uniref:hypothetical protein n=1 Tax=Roseateles chitinivorans TaxID=2917965 RepID=UPI003D67EAF8
MLGKLRAKADIDLRAEKVSVDDNVPNNFAVLRHIQGFSRFESVGYLDLQRAHALATGIQHSAAPLSQYQRGLSADGGHEVGGCQLSTAKTWRHDIDHMVGVQLRQHHATRRSGLLTLGCLQHYDAGFKGGSLRRWRV